MSFPASTAAPITQAQTLQYLNPRYPPWATWIVARIRSWRQEPFLLRGCLYAQTSRIRAVKPTIAAVLGQKANLAQSPSVPAECSWHQLCPRLYLRDYELGHVRQRRDDLGDIAIRVLPNQT